MVPCLKKINYAYDLYFLASLCFMSLYQKRSLLADNFWVFSYILLNVNKSLRNRNNIRLKDATFDMRPTESMKHGRNRNEQLDRITIMQGKKT